MEKMKIPKEKIIEYKFSGVAKALSPIIFKDGESFCCSLGANPEKGVFGYGESPEAAVVNWDEKLQKHLKQASDTDPIVIYTKNVLASIPEVIPPHIQEFYDQFHSLKKNVPKP